MVGLIQIVINCTFVLNGLKIMFLELFLKVKPDNQNQDSENFAVCVKKKTFITFGYV